MAQILRATQFAVASIHPKDKKGNPTTLDGAAVWSVEPAGIVTLEPSADGLTCRVIAQALGFCQLQVSGDVLDGPDVLPLNEETTVEVKAGVATTFGIQFGEPAEQVDAPVDPVDPPVDPVDPPVDPVDPPVDPVDPPVDPIPASE